MPVLLEYTRGCIQVGHVTQVICGIWKKNSKKVLKAPEFRIATLVETMCQERESSVHCGQKGTTKLVAPKCERFTGQHLGVLLALPAII